MSSLSDDGEDCQDNVELNHTDDANDNNLVSELVSSSSNLEKWGIHTNTFPATMSNFCLKLGFHYDCSKPIECFMEYLDDDFFREMSHFINIRLELQAGKSANVSHEEIQTFIGCSILLSCYGYLRIKILWDRFTWIPIIADNIA